MRHRMHNFILWWVKMNDYLRSVLPGPQLLNEYSPIAAGFLGILIPIFEPVGWAHAEPGTLLGYQYSFAAIVAIAVSAGLGLLVSLSTFLVIGATSSLTYNVVGHIKTVIILMGGCMFFGDTMPLKKLGGISIAMCGIIWYSQVRAAAPCRPQYLLHARSPARNMQSRLLQVYICRSPLLLLSTLSIGVTESQPEAHPEGCMREAGHCVAIKSPTIRESVAAKVKHC